ncbi:related to PHO36 (regulatory role in lipid and phosphate metabolism) [Phialocephala subalpina]|uniref:Related to PHO36 (Regulatory role in lipid and phosphate metabolism) n=1 Tax=Phialocephala subalpina TaxID=576137 RepID=A0A1L7X9T2_9HELO|nr:related to PHO36 (regulatory role in lipid and phosphate metabolism) [Phialocephala subalpina]
MSVRQRRPSTTEVIADAAKNVGKHIQNTLTVLWDDLPSWQQDNHYIHSGYRPASASFQKSFASLGYLHNESVNIYSHLLGALMFSSIGIVLYTSIKLRYESAAFSDILAFGCFFAGAALCLGMSATYHAISNHSPIVAKFGNKLDYVGIVFLITGSFIPSIYYGFYCHPHLQEFYWTMICSLGVGCASVSIFERFRTPAWRPYRAGMFVLMGLSAVFPVLHGLEMYGMEDMRHRIGLTWLVLQGFLYILGAGLYAARWPERSWPGTFDIWGSSHQIFHVLVVMAAGSHLYGLLRAFDFHHSVLGLAC